MEDLTGRQLGRYRVTAPLGEGGMAAVYRAYQPGMDREVAVKVLPRHFASEADFVARFSREARLIANLEHQNIVPVYDFAHARGVLHRDIKPSNVLVDASGNCLLTDFGLARMAEGSSQLTQTGGILGTPAYMSPEQALGRPVDARTDIYALGVVLYEMAARRLPFHAETPVALSSPFPGAPHRCGRNSHRWRDRSSLSNPEDRNRKRRSSKRRACRSAPIKLPAASVSSGCS